MHIFCAEGYEDINFTLSRERTTDNLLNVADSHALYFIRQLLYLLFYSLAHRCQNFFLIISVSTLHKTNVPIKEKFNKIVFIALTKVKHLTIHCMKILKML